MNNGFKKVNKWKCARPGEFFPTHPTQPTFPPAKKITFQPGMQVMLNEYA